MREKQAEMRYTNAPEEHLLEHSHCRYYAGLAAGGKCMKLHVRGNEGGRELGVRCCSSAATADVVRDVVDLSRTQDSASR